MKWNDGDQMGILVVEVLLWMNEKSQKGGDAGGWLSTLSNWEAAVYTLDNCGRQ